MPQQNQELWEPKPPVALRIVPWIAWGFVALGALAWAYGAFWFHKEASTLEHLGAYGSYLQGAVASLWSLAALLLIYVAFVAQREQLDHQRRSFEIERVEGAFSQLLNLHLQVLDGFEHSAKREGDQKTKFVGKNVFIYYYSLLRNVTKSCSDSDPTVEDTLETYESLFDIHKNSLGNYFRTLYQVISFVDESGLSVADKKRFVNIVRAQLSQAELLILFYNCLGLYGIEKFKPLVNTYALFKHLDCDELVNPDHKNEFPDCAYGRKQRGPEVKIVTHEAAPN